MSQLYYLMPALLWYSQTDFERLRIIQTAHYQKITVSFTLQHKHENLFSNFHFFEEPLGNISNYEHYHTPDSFYIYNILFLNNGVIYSISN
jgi:hypothetical protein